MRPLSSPRKLVTGDQVGLPGGGDTNDAAQSGGSSSGNKQKGEAGPRQAAVPNTPHRQGNRGFRRNQKSVTYVL